jgi:MFS family permease
VDSVATDAARGMTPARTAVRRLALGRVISFTGTFAAGTALTFTIYQRTHSTLWVSATMLLTWGLIGFFGPVAGAVGDRFDRRRVMIVSEVGATVCWIAMAFLVDAPAALLAVAFASSVSESPYFPASGAAIPNIAGKDHLSWANSLVAMGRNTGLTLGPVVGGVLVAAIGSRWVFALNAASYAVSAALTWSVRARFADPDRTVEQAEEHRGVSAGWRFILADRVLRQMMIAWFVFLIGMATTIVADPVLAEEFGVGSLGYGLITACWGGGTILGALLARRIREQSEGAWLVGASFLLASTGFGVALSPWFGLALFWVLAFGISDGPTIVVEQNLLQRRTPDVVRSRVMGAWEMGMHAGLITALVIGGIIVPIVGPKGAYAFGGITGLIGAVILLPVLRWLPGPQRVSPAIESAEPERLDRTV